MRKYLFWRPASSPCNRFLQSCILHTSLHGNDENNLLLNQDLCSLLITSYSLKTFVFDWAVLLSGEINHWSLHKGLIHNSPTSQDIRFMTPTVTKVLSMFHESWDHITDNWILRTYSTKCIKNTLMTHRGGLELVIVYIHCWPIFCWGNKMSFALFYFSIRSMP